MIIEAREGTITLTGDMPKNIWPAIQAAAALLLKDHPQGIIIDASGLNQVTTKGGETFVDASDYISNHNARIVVTGLSEEVLAIISEVPGVRSRLPVTDSIEEARASLALDEVSIRRGKAHIAGLVPLVGNWERSVYFASRLATGINSELHLLELMKVPRDLPIGTPLPEAESNSQRRLDLALDSIKKEKVRSYGHMERVRSYREGTFTFSESLNADFVVLSIDENTKAEPSIEEYKALGMLKMSKQELSIVKSGAKVNKAVPQRGVVPAVGEWRHALEHTARLISGPQAALTLVHLITIHRSKPIDDAMPEIEKKVQAEYKEAARICRAYGVKVQSLVKRVRTPSLAFVRMLETIGADLVVIGLSAKEDSDNATAESVAKELISNTYCETVVIQVL